MTLQRDRALYERLAEHVTNRSVLDNPALSIKQIYQRLTFHLNNDDVKVELTAAAEDSNESETMDTNY